MQAIDSFFAWLFHATLQASVVIPLVLVAQWVFRRHLSPRWRHALWLLVVLRLAMPVGVESRVSVFNWLAVGRVAPLAGAQAAVIESSEASGAGDGEMMGSSPAGGTAEPGRARVSMRRAVGWIWTGGVLLLPGLLVVRTLQLKWSVRERRPVTNSTVLNILEDCKDEMGVRTPLLLVETPAVTSPSLFGFVRPRLLIPPALLEQFTPAELRYVFLHELGHIKRGDIVLNWLTTTMQILHWFNPLVWFAFTQMRADRELACDALALSRAKETENQPYGQTIIKLLEHFSRSAAAPNLVGILETRNLMKRRIGMIAEFKKNRGVSVVALAVFASLALMTLTDAQTTSGMGGKTTWGAGAEGEAIGEPVVIAVSPGIGENDVDPALARISVTFDRDMSGGFSWTGGGPDFPSSPEGMQASWADKRTCVLPVKLEAAKFYRVGINSKSFRNFQSVEGVPAKPMVLYFTTKGASEETRQKTIKPKIVDVTPLHLATDVDPNLTQITITFNVPMGSGFSWTGSGPHFPVVPEGKGAYWSEDRKTCVMPVELKPDWDYTVGLNSQHHNNFQSAAGVPLDPHTLSFRTRHQ